MSRPVYKINRNSRQCFATHSNHHLKVVRPCQTAGVTAACVMACHHNSIEVTDSGCRHQFQSRIFQQTSFFSLLIIGECQIDCYLPLARSFSQSWTKFALNSPLWAVITALWTPWIDWCPQFWRVVFCPQYLNALKFCPRVVCLNVFKFSLSQCQCRSGAGPGVTPAASPAVLCGPGRQTPWTGCGSRVNETWLGTAAQSGLFSRDRPCLWRPLPVAVAAGFKFWPWPALGIAGTWSSLCRTPAPARDLIPMIRQASAWVLAYRITVSLRLSRAAAAALRPRLFGSTGMVISARNGWLFILPRSRWCDSIWAMFNWLLISWIWSGNIMLVSFLTTSSWLRNCWMALCAIL